MHFTGIYHVYLMYKVLLNLMKCCQYDHDTIVLWIAKIREIDRLVTTQFRLPDRHFTAALIRVLPAGILLLLFTRRLHASRDIGGFIILSALNTGVFQALLFVTAYRLPGGLAAVLGGYNHWW